MIVVTLSIVAVLDQNSVTANLCHTTKENEAAVPGLAQNLSIFFFNWQVRDVKLAVTRQLNVNTTMKK